MRRTAIVGVIFFATPLIAGSKASQAITLPDNSSCSTTNVNGCFKITNTNTGAANAITGATSGSGVGVLGNATGTSVAARGVVGGTVNGYGVYGIASGTGYGVFALSENSHGLYARTNAPGSGAYAIYAYTASEGATAIVGQQAGNDSGTAIEGRITDSSGNPVSNGFAIRGSNGGISVLGDNSVGGTGVMGDSDFGIGVLGDSIDYIGVQGISTHGIAIEGISTNNDGVHAVTHHANRSGVFAENLAAGGGGFGIFASATGTGQAVHGENTNAAGFAGFFNGKVFASGGYTTPSDARLKKDIHQLPYGLAELVRLRPVVYKWKKGDDQVQLGLIAQELQKVIPEVVQVDANSGMLAVNYPALVPLMIEAVKDQQKVIKDQQKVIEKLDSRLTALEHGRSPTSSSLLTGSLGMGLVLALLPVGLVVALGKRRDRRGKTV
jgi:hypothetical protein